MPFTSLSKLCKNVGPKRFCWAKLAWFDFSSSNLNLWAHILSTGGIPLGNCILEMWYPTTILGFRVLDELTVLQVPLLDHHTYHMAIIFIPTHAIIKFVTSKRFTHKLTWVGLNNDMLMCMFLVWNFWCFYCFMKGRFLHFIHHAPTPERCMFFQIDFFQQLNSKLLGEVGLPHC